MNPQTKICSKCKQEKELKEFRNQFKGKYHKKNYCIICDNENAKELYLKNKDFRILQIEEWNQNHPEKLKEYQKKWKINN